MKLNDYKPSYASSEEDWNAWHDEKLMRIAQTKWIRVKND